MVIDKITEYHINTNKKIFGEDEIKQLLFEKEIKMQTKFNPKKGGYATFKNTVLRNYVIDLKKRKQEENAFMFFTDFSDIDIPYYPNDRVDAKIQLDMIESDLSNESGATWKNMLITFKLLRSGYKQKEIARKLNVHISYVNRLIREKLRPFIARRLDY